MAESRKKERNPSAKEMKQSVCKAAEFFNEQKVKFRTHGAEKANRGVPVEIPLK